MQFFKKVPLNRIPQEIYDIIARINLRYNNIVLRGKTEEEKLAKLIDEVNSDEDLKTLCRVTTSIKVVYPDSPEPVSSLGWIMTIRSGCQCDSCNFGVNLCLDNRRLYIYDFEDIWGKESKIKEISAKADVLLEYRNSITAEELRQAIISYTERSNYEKYATSFNTKFNLEAA